jgi:hypothetical protein
MLNDKLINRNAIFSLLHTYVRAYVHTYSTYLHIYLHTCIHTNTTSIQPPLHPSVHTYVHTYSNTYTYTYIHAYTQTLHQSNHLSIHPSIRTYIHTYIYNTHTHVHTESSSVVLGLNLIKQQSSVLFYLVQFGLKKMLWENLIERECFICMQNGSLELFRDGDTRHERRTSSVSLLALTLN